MSRTSDQLGKPRPDFRLKASIAFRNSITSPSSRSTGGGGNSSRIDRRGASTFLARGLAVRLAAAAAVGGVGGAGRIWDFGLLLGDMVALPGRRTRNSSFRRASARILSEKDGAAQNKPERGVSAGPARGRPRAGVTGERRRMPRSARRPDS